MRRLARALLLLLPLLAAPAFAGVEEFLSGVRSPEEGRRRAALGAILSDPAFVPEADFDRARKALVPLLRDDPRPDLRGLAARVLALHRTTETDVRIAEQLGKESDWKAQRPMLDALTGSRDEALVALLETRIFKDPRLDVRILWIEALGRCDGARAAATLRSLAGTPMDWPLAEAAAVALARHPAPETVTRLVDMLWTDDEGVRAAAHESLVALTGQRSLPPEPNAWMKWWEENRAGFRFPGAAPPAAEVKTVSVEPVTLPKYYDIPIRGRRVVFCLDVSASMWGMKAENASAELARAVRCLPTTVRFSVIFFNEFPHPWKEELVPAFPFQKLDCVTTFKDLETKKYTNIFDTLECALGFAGVGRYALADPPGLDEVFLLTDGEPNRGRYRDLDGMIAGLQELDPRNAVRIHTVSVGETPKALLAGIAKARGGSHAHVDAPR